jgi:hypothetical protein
MPTGFIEFSREHYATIPPQLSATSIDKVTLSLETALDTRAKTTLSQSYIGL